MRRLLVGLAVLMTFPALFAGCARGNPGPVTSRTYEHTAFSKIEVGSAFEVEVVQSSTWSVVLTAQEKLFEQIAVTKSGDTLEINLEWGWGTWVSSWGYQRPKARITVPELSVLKLSGASKGSARGFKSDHDTDVFLSGASSLDIDIEAAGSGIEVSGASRLTGRLKANDVRLQVNGASNATLSGSAVTIDLDASGASRAELTSVPASEVKVVLSGASRATVAPKDTISVELSGASSLTYSGNPALQSVEISGASTIHKQ
jgi:hypothetical protein